jgi:hypothetical protein
MTEQFGIEAQIADFHKRIAMQGPEDRQLFVLTELVSELKRMRDAVETVAEKIDLIENKMM